MTEKFAMFIRGNNVLQWHIAVSLHVYRPGQNNKNAHDFQTNKASIGKKKYIFKSFQKKEKKI